MLQLKDALTIFEKKNGRGLRIPFSVQFCTADVIEWRKYLKLKAKIDALPVDAPQRAEMLDNLNKIDFGGDIITIDKAVLSGAAPLSRAEKSEKNDVVKRFSPNHSQNKTRNFKILLNKEIRKAHLRLILKVNNQEVLY